MNNPTILTNTTTITLPKRYIEMKLQFVNE